MEKIKQTQAIFEYGEWVKKWNREKIYFLREGYYNLWQSYYGESGYHIEEQIVKDRERGWKNYIMRIYRNNEKMEIIRAYANLESDDIILSLKLNDEGYTTIRYRIESLSDLYRKLEEFGFKVKNWREIRFEKDKWAKEFVKIVYGTKFFDDYIRDNFKSNELIQTTLMKVALESM